MTTTAPRSVVSTLARPAPPEVLMIGARRTLSGLAEVLTEARVRFTNLGGPFGLGAELEQRQPLLLAIGDELGSTELSAVGRSPSTAMSAVHPMTQSNRPIAAKTGSARITATNPAQTTV